MTAFTYPCVGDPIGAESGMCVLTWDRLATGYPLGEIDHVPVLLMLRWSTPILRPGRGIFDQLVAIS